MADDPLSSALEEIRARNAKTTYADPLTHAASAEDVPRLVAAFRVLVVFHAQYMTTEEYAAILAALTGEDGRG